jgi:rhodanese-related sulfurtransferase/glyoxylase-like metal-dependent hydrolase (beta-lactamase superfamily II)
MYSVRGVIFRQLINDDLGCASYLVGDEDAGVAAVVDPRLEVDEYLALARYMGVHIAHVLETHTHADHVSGHGRLAAATGAVIHVHRDAGAQFEHDPIDEGWALDLGAVRVVALHTPGHRPEHTAFALVDTTRGPEPWAVLTGDSLFVGDVARPDLAVTAEEGARDIFRSLHGGLLGMAPEVEVWPGHLGGSLCGGPAMSMKVSSTIGYERSHNPQLAERDEDRFVQASLAAIGVQPPNFRRIVEINRGPLVTMDAPALPMTPVQVLRRQQEGALIVDVRADVQFDDAHIPGAVAVTALRAGFGTRLGWLAPPRQEVVLVGRDDADSRRAAGLAAAVGVDGVVGHLAGGMTSWREEGRPVARTARLDVEALAERMDADPDVQLIDVRETAEWRRVRIPGALHRPWHALREPVPELDPARPVAVICASGQRAAIGASLIAGQGVPRVFHVIGGGVEAWERLGRPVEREA